LFLDIDMIN